MGRINSEKTGPKKRRERSHLKHIQKKLNRTKELRGAAADPVPRLRGGVRGVGRREILLNPFPMREGR